jgi:hypothetical protein
MALLSKLLGFVFDDRLGKLAALAVAGTALFAWFVYEQRAIGDRRAVIRQEKVDAAARTRTEAAARKSADPAARGLPDPNRVD